MSETTIIYVVSWLIVYPLLLILALLVFKFCYQSYREYLKRAEREKAIKRIEEKERKK